MRKRLTLYSILFAALLLVPGVFAAAQPYNFSDATGDLVQVATAVSSIFGPNLGGMSYIGEPVGYSVVPHVAFGISGGAVFVPLQNINTGTSMAVDFGDMGGLAALPIPAVGAHAKFTLFKKLEMGVKVAGIPEIENEKSGFAVDNLIIGGKVRYNLLKYKLPLIRGGVSVGALYEYMNGSLLLTQSDTIPLDVNDDGMMDGSFTTTAGLNTEWTSSTFGGEAQANIQVIFLNIFLGTRVSKTVGKATTSINGTGTLTDFGGGLVNAIPPPDPTISISQEGKPDGIDPYVFGGVEAKLLGIVLSAKGTYNLKNENYIVEGGLRLQF
jgi:hypothetical protein